MNDDHHWMQHAIRLAKKAEQNGEVPVGAVLVKENQLISEGFNAPISQCDPSAHAEIQAIRQGALLLNNYRLNGTTLYVTLEPCPMCAGAILYSRIKRLVYAVDDPKSGAVKSLFNVLQNKSLNHRVDFVQGVCEQECRDLLVNFFTSKRKRCKAEKFYPVS